MESINNTRCMAMPILQAEPDYFPADLWDREHLPYAQDESAWWCLHTKPRQEKAVARQLMKNNIAYYLPQVMKESHTPQGRKIRSIVPLFSSYMFFYGDRHDRLEAIRGDRLVNVLEVRDQNALVRDLHQIYQMLASGLLVSSEHSVSVGATVRITSGPLTGMLGTVLRKGNRDQFAIEVRFLGRAAKVDLLNWQIEEVVD
jgi:transcription antitermination factor NusG